MTDRPTPNPRAPFEARLASAFAAYADRAPIDVDAVSLTAVVASGEPGSARRGWPRNGSRWLMPALLGLLLLTALAGALLIGAQLLITERPPTDVERLPAVVLPSPLASEGPVLPARLTIEPTGSMASHRVGHTATVLDDGRVLVVGGFGYGQDATNSAGTAEIYDPTSGAFSSVAALQDGRQFGHTATRLADGRVLIVGGRADQDLDTPFPILATTELVDPLSGTSRATGSLAARRWGHAAVLLADGRVAIIGGSAEAPNGEAPVSSIEIFDPATEAFSPGPSAPSLRRLLPEAAVLGDGRVLIIGGDAWASDGEILADGDWNSDVAVIWDPTSGDIHETATFRDPRSAAADASPGDTPSVGDVATLGDGPILITALDASRTAWGLTLFDPSTETFAFLGAIPGRADGGSVVTAPVIATLADGRVLLVTGDAADCSTVQASVFDPSTSSIAPVGVVPRLGTCNGGGGVSVSALADGSALIAGGHQPGGESVTDAWIVRPVTASSPRSGYDSLIVRPISDGSLPDLDVIAVRADGTERVVRRLTDTDLPESWSFTGGGKASDDGWIAMLTGGPGSFRQAESAYALFDLADPARPALMVPTTHTGEWGTDHQFATTVSNIDVIEVVDADTGARTKVGGVSLPGGGPDIVWAADGSGIVWRQFEGRQHAIRPIDGGPPTPITALDFRRGSRYLAAGGTSLEAAEGVLADRTADFPADVVPPGTVQVREESGAPIVWYRGELEPSRLLDASFSTDGRSLWLLLKRMDGTHHVADVARLDAPGQATVVASVDLGEDVAWMWFEAFAPDDSVIAIGHWTGTLGTDSTPGDTTPGPMTFVRLDGIAMSSHEGSFAGFVPAAVTEALGAVRP